jgi:hypothetical protein
MEVRFDKGISRTMMPRKTEAQSPVRKIAIGDR